MTRVAGLIAIGAAMACTGSRSETFHACDCSFELPSGWTTWVDDETWTAQDWSESQSLRVQFLSRADQGMYTSAVLHDNWLGNEWPLPVDVAPTEPIDGTAATIRDLGAYWTAMVPYHDGWVYIEAWSEAGAEGWTDAQAVARSLSRPEVPVVLPSWVEPAEPRSEAVMERPTEVHAPDRQVRLPGQEVPAAWLPSDYTSPVGRLASFVTPVVNAQAGPGLVYVHDGFGIPHPAELVEPVARFPVMGIPVMIPTFRGEYGNPGQREHNAGEVADLASAIRAFRERADVDPDQVYVLGAGSGSAVAMFAAMVDDRLAGTVTMDGALDMAALRRRTGDGAPVEQDLEIQDALRSPVHYASQISSPVWAFHGDFSPHAADGAAMQHAASAAGVPFTWLVVPRGMSTAHWPGFLTDALTRRISDPAVDEETGESQPLAFDEAFAVQLGRHAWSSRWVHARSWVREGAHDLARTRLVRPARIVEVLVEQRRGLDIRPVRTEAWSVLNGWEGPAPSPEALGLHAALSTLAEAGLAVRPARPEHSPEAGLAEALDQNPQRGFVYMTGMELMRSVRSGRPVTLYYGDGFPRDPTATAAIGREIIAALHAQGLRTFWSGDPAAVIGVRVDWGR